MCAANARYFDLRNSAKKELIAARLQKNASYAAAELEGRKELAQQQKAALADVFNQRNRPSWAKPSLRKVYLVPRRYQADFNMCTLRSVARYP
jgi:hypothetical protein